MIGPELTLYLASFGVQVDRKGKLVSLVLHNEKGAGAEAQTMVAIRATMTPAQADNLADVLRSWARAIRDDEGGDFSGGECAAPNPRVAWYPCALPAGHEGPHRNGEREWPR